MYGTTLIAKYVSEVGKEGWTQMETQKGDTEGDTNGRVTKGGNSL